MRPAPSERFWRVPFDHDRISRVRGTVHVREERCKGCLYCVEFCPRHVMVRSERFNAKGYHPPEVVRAEGCTACKLCEILCPEFAIGVVECAAETSHAC